MCDARRQRDNLRKHLEGAFSVSEFLISGSFKRRTAIRPLNDIDLFVVFDSDAERQLQRAAPSVVLRRVQDVLDDAYPTKDKPKAQSRSVNVEFSGTGLSFDVVPAFKDSSGRGYLIPDRDAASWIRTDPRKHAEYATQANTRAGNKAKPIIKALKSWNAQQNKVVRSFHLELMVYDVLQSDPGNYAGGIAQALRGLASRVRYPMPEPARVGPDVDQGMSQAERDRARAAFSEAADLADKATAAADRLATSEAHYHWRQLLGPTYPEPGTAPRKPGTASSHADGNAPDPGSRRFG